MVTFDTINNADLMLKNLTKLKFANENLRQLRFTPDRSLKLRENVRFLVQRAKNLTAEESGDYIHIVRGDRILRVKKRLKTQEVSTDTNVNNSTSGSGMSMS